MTAFVRKGPGSVPAAQTFPSRQAPYYEFTGVEEPQRSDDPLLGKAFNNRGNSEKRIESRLMLSPSPVLYTSGVFWKKPKDMQGCFEVKLVFEPKAVRPVICEANVAASWCHLKMIFRTPNYCLCLHPHQYLNLTKTLPKK